MPGQYGTLIAALEAATEGSVYAPGSEFRSTWGYESNGFVKMTNGWWRWVDYANDDYAGEFGSTTIVAAYSNWVLDLGTTLYDTIMENPGG